MNAQYSFCTSLLFPSNTPRGLLHCSVFVSVLGFEQSKRILSSTVVFGDVCVCVCVLALVACVVRQLRLHCWCLERWSFETEACMMTP
jgi:hypothetical protein